MADEAIGDAAAATAAEGGAVLLIPNPDAEAAEHGESPTDVAAPIPGQGLVDALELRVAALEERVAVSEGSILQYRGEIDGRAMIGHDHPTDDDVRILAEELRALREEEVAPNRSRLPERGWLRRWLRGR